MLLPASDASPADWLVERLTTFAESVVSLVPDGFPAYVRVRHPYGLREQPASGTLELPALRALAAILAGHTTTPDDCYFAVWEGYGGSYAFDRDAAPTFTLPHRRYHLLRGPVASVAGPVLDPPYTMERANLWWSSDRRWCVATEIDLYSTYVACDEAAADELTACGRYDVERVAAAAGITAAADPYGL